MNPVDDLSREWREKADELRELALESVARAYEDCASTLELSLMLQREEPLTLQEAAEFSGYSADHLGRLIREGTIPNHGRPGAPRVTRQDLPTKPVNRSPVAKCPPSSDRNPRQIVRSIIHGDR